MVRNIYVTVIRDYILEKPGRPFEEVSAYAQEMNATDDELKKAILDVDTIMKSQAKSKPQAPGKTTSTLFTKKSKVHVSLHKPNLTSINIMRTVTIASLIGVCILGASSLYLFNRVQGISQRLNSTSTIASNSNVGISSDGLLAPIVHPAYANQQAVDSSEIFSYPADNITLKFGGAPKKKIFGFLPYWMNPVTDKINTTGFTDIAVFGLTTDGRGNILTSFNGSPEEGWSAWNSSEMTKFINNARRKRQKLHLVIKSFNNDDIESLVANDKYQAQFIANAIQLAQSRSFNGINLDFEYVGTAPVKTQQDFTRFIKNFSEELKRQEPEMDLTVDTYIAAAAEPKFVEVEEIAPYVDSFVLMGYDFHTAKGGPGPVAPLEGKYSLTDYLESYLEQVAPEKIILAVPYYGYDWSVKSATPNKILPYAEVAFITKKSKTQWDSFAKTPYYRYTDSATGDSRIVHYENPRSLGLKYDLINNKNLNGVGIWAMGYDGNNQDLHQVLLDKFTQ